ncbi:Adenosine 3'-phospho 5'-phosphosulfate transporter 2 [Willisornis vidua]|uniref:Adenosine 3'-phospho 5'-phosphosulfate transporter 2 n=1 Tax=Willisornis vidua TaxID=1566151 RepID=A0ABQ9D528_9PASS|nr:Adenosine 3'-phospho 5'-phosphosulfate transporter 2 [Willisornis vidua]
MPSGSRWEQEPGIRIREWGGGSLLSQAVTPVSTGIKGLLKATVKLKVAFCSKCFGVDTLLSDRRHTEREKQKEDNSTECSEPGAMDLKFTSSRKYISISVPSKSQAMSPHIKSVDDVVVLGMNLSKFSKPTQFFICVSGVFMFYLIYGYLQIFKLDIYCKVKLSAFKSIRIPGKTYMIIAFLTVGTMGLSNTSLGYLNYPTQVIFKCCKLIPVMIGGVFIQGKRYNIVDVSAALCMSLGLIWFTLADSTVAPNFNLTGVVLISLALCADAVIGNVQEKAMKLHNGSNSEMVNTRFAIIKEYDLS